MLSNWELNHITVIALRSTASLTFSDFQIEIHVKGHLSCTYHNSHNIGNYIASYVANSVNYITVRNQQYVATCFC